MNWKYDPELENLVKMAKQPSPIFNYEELQSKFLAAFSKTPPSKPTLYNRPRISDPSKRIQRLSQSIQKLSKSDRESSSDSMSSSNSEKSLHLEISIISKVESKTSNVEASQPPKVSPRLKIIGTKTLPKKTNNNKAEFTFSELKRRLDEDCEQMLMEKDLEEEILLDLLEAVKNNKEKISQTLEQFLNRFRFSLMKKCSKKDILNLIKKKCVYPL